MQLFCFGKELFIDLLEFLVQSNVKKLSISSRNTEEAQLFWKKMTNFPYSYHKIENTIDPKDYEISVKDFVIEKLNKECRYIKIKAKNFGTIPSWHEGAGGEGFIFIDEIFFE